MASKQDYYETLGVKKSATKDEIKSAYRKLAKKYHPDNKETGDENRFKQIQEAYDILYDDKKRAAYDQFGHAAFETAGSNPGANPFQGAGFSGFGFGDNGVDLGDIFSSFFGGGRRAKRNPSGPQRGEDSILRIKIDFMDAVNGKDITLPLNIEETCSSCHGSGARTAQDVHVCNHCNGRGYVNVQRRTLFGVVESQEVCPNCMGSGKVISDKCPTCGGKGYVKNNVDVKVHIPAGINNGQQIRVAGRGERGRNGGPSGDLFVEVVIKPHPTFERQGNDIHVEVPLDFVDAILGTKIDVPTVYGEATLSIPSGTQPGQVLRMKGQGIKDLRTSRPGDQYVHLNIKTPTNLSKEQKELLLKFKDAAKPNSSFFEKFKKSFKR